VANVRLFKKIKLTKGKFALVDAEDFERLNQWKWYLHSTGYAVRSDYIKKSLKTIKMHVEILGEKPGKEIDHINGKKSDNRKVNLRHCSRSENQSNRPKNKNNSTGYKGVKAQWTGKRFTYQARIIINRKYVHLGTFKTKLEAHRAYIKKAKELHGEFARWK
jgi:hypothetical protein